MTGSEDTGADRDLDTRDVRRVAYLVGDLTADVDPVEREELDDLLGLLADPAMWEEPDEALEDRVVLAVQASARNAEAPEPPPAVQLGQPKERERRQRRVRSRQFSFRLRMGVAVVGAAAAVVIGVVAVSVSPPDRGAAQFSVALGATTLQPGAEGSATLTKTLSGWRIQLQARDLPRLDHGRFYQAWLRDARGVLVAVGTFNEGKHVTLWAGVSPKDYPTLIVTAQNAGDNQPSVDRTILVGTARNSR